MVKEQENTTGGKTNSRAPANEFKASELEVGGVVVYPDRAEVKRLIRVILRKGENNVVVNQLPSVVDPKSLRVEGEGRAIITDVIYQSKTSQYDKTTGDKKQYDLLQDEIKELREKVKVLSFKMDVIEKQRNLLNKFAEQICKFSNSKEKVSDVSEILKGGSVDGVMGFLAAYQRKLSYFDLQWQQYDREKKTLSDQILVFTDKAANLNPTTVKEAKVNRSVCISLEAAEDTDVTLALSYVVSSASWSPQYDLRVFSSDKTMKVQYYGLIKQSTGEDWTNAKLSLSTANPSIGGSVPELGMQLLKFKRIHIARKTKWNDYSNAYSFGSTAMYDPTIEDSFCDDEMWECAMVRDGAAPPPVEVVTTEVESNWTSVAFNIPRKTTIPSDNTEHKVSVAIIDFKPEFEYTMVPRMSLHTYLQAVVTNTSSYSILSGPANVFLDNNFIAKSSLKDVSPSEEFQCSLGVDPSIRLTTVPLKIVRGQTGVISKSVSMGYKHVFEVKNTKQEQVKVVLSEQLPLSTDERIKVILNEPQVKKVNVPAQLPFGTVSLNSSNNLEWVANISADTKQPFILRYTVEHPPGEVVEGLPKL